MKIWMPEEIEQRLRSAAQTLRVLPRPKNGSPATMAAAWPDIVRRVFHDAPKDLVMRAAVPPAADITEMDEALQWLHLVNERERRILWARACKVSWRRLEDVDGSSHMTLRKVHREALIAIAAQLNKGVPVRNSKTGFTNFIKTDSLSP